MFSTQSRDLNRIQSTHLATRTQPTAYNFMCIPAYHSLTLSWKESAHTDFYVTDWESVSRRIIHTSISRQKNPQL